MGTTLHVNGHECTRPVSSATTPLPTSAGARVVDVAPWPYVALGCGYAVLAVGLLLVGAQRQRELEHALRTGGHVPLRFRAVATFTGGGVVLAVMTSVLGIAQF